ncbi:MAG: 16S rRNA (adenine(1518)-N(6)/adenine(1519)-N(6))-dimethyltransferase, partial [Actinobacteria bacterium]|nr:16S rRNA (adenine(1518)-N(6)/adenine(1519)-N(6))-dimethyltransferase [Actinomycetota bacterium]
MSADEAAQLLGAVRIRQLASELNLRPTKQRGQNFVVDANTVRRIVQLANVDVDDVVLEVGPGLGSLTLGLLPKVQQVIAVEIDDVLAGALPKTISEQAPTLVDRLQ